MAPRFFGLATLDDEAALNGDGRPPIPYRHPRAIVAATERIKVGKDGAAATNTKRPTSAWQTAAWNYFDSIGELHFAFSTMGSILSRVRLYVAVVTDPDQAPVAADVYLKSLMEEGLQAPNTAATIGAAENILDSLVSDIDGGVSGMMRALGINLAVPGETYLVNVPSTTPNAQPAQVGWHVASTDELTTNGTNLVLKTARTTGSTMKNRGVDLQLPENSYVARIWRPHPRWRSEPDSSMVGILDDCEQLMLLQQAMRAITRSRMSVGIMYLPDGLVAHSQAADEITVEDAIVDAATTSITEESALTTVVPIIIRGPAELADKIKMIEWGRRVDDSMLQQVEETLNRILAGIDFPKEAVSGLVNLRYSNAVIVDDNLFRLHIEPLILLIVDSLTEVYLQPLLKRATIEQNGNADIELLDRIVVWADSSEIVTRPDRSQAANDGYDRRILSADAWRAARGFADTDAPDPDELLARVVLDRGVLPPDVTQLLLERLDPAWFGKMRGQNLGGVPGEISELLGPGTEAPPSEELVTEAAPSTTSGIEDMREGGPIEPGGSVAPVPNR